MTDNTPEWAAKMLAAMMNVSGVSGPPLLGAAVGATPMGTRAKPKKGWQGAGKGKGSGKGGGAGAGSGQNVWACSCVFKANFAARVNCWVCSAPRSAGTQPGGNTAPKSPPEEAQRLSQWGVLAKGRGLEEFRVWPRRNSKRTAACKARTGAARLTGQVSPVTPAVSAAVEPQAGQLWPKPGDGWGDADWAGLRHRQTWTKSFQSPAGQGGGRTSEDGQSLKAALDGVPGRLREGGPPWRKRPRHKCEECCGAALPPGGGCGASEQQRLDEIKHRFAHNGGVERMCGHPESCWRGAGGAPFNGSCSNGTSEGSRRAFQEEFPDPCMRKAGALHVHCLPGGVAQVPPVEPGIRMWLALVGQAKPGPRAVVGSVADQASPVEPGGCRSGTDPVGQPRPGESGPTQAAALLASPKRARDQSDTDPVQTGRRRSKSAAADAMQVGPSRRKRQKTRRETRKWRTRMVSSRREAGGEAGPKGRLPRRGWSRTGRCPPETPPRKKGKGAQPDLKDFFHGRAAQRAAVEPAPGSKEAKKAAKEAAKQAAKDRAKVKKQAKK